MENSDLYPNRVTKDSHGIYRWSVQVNMNQDHSTRDQFRTAMLIVLGSVLVIMLITMAVIGDFTYIWIPFACTGFVLLISFPIFRLWQSSLRDRFTVSYEMNEEAILTIWDLSVQEQVKNMALITAALSVAAGHPVQGIGYGMSAGAASQPVLTKFQSVRNIRESRRESRLELKMLPTPRSIWVPAEDYEMVLDFIQKRVADVEHHWNPFY